ncbi:hypothetical protein MIPYR_40219 [uncultured Microbacterium sp.]|uniref:Uncharacterized protein n=1 Tax=uncultured Microbacterium sp. TaxID=191216 RepID=A0A1Y5P4A2_9MICO|nr:hypothetical protein MIPYR_40219 [uncultured Microbacterium sp.]
MPLTRADSRVRGRVTRTVPRMNPCTSPGAIFDSGRRLATGERIARAQAGFIRADMRVRARQTRQLARMNQADVATTKAPPSERTAGPGTGEVSPARPARPRGCR